MHQARVAAMVNARYKRDRRRIVLAIKANEPCYQDFSAPIPKSRFHIEFFAN